MMIDSDFNKNLKIANTISKRARERLQRFLTPLLNSNSEGKLLVIFSDEAQFRAVICGLREWERRDDDVAE